ncbi:unnamed protein product [Auanema sp. JU1783]|nr:unnamed protein product [Auanema sp. JU1783]
MKALHLYKCLPSARRISTSSAVYWQNYENERHYEPGEDVLNRTWHGLTYDFRRWKRRYLEARKDAFQRRNTIAHMKRSVLDNEVFPFRAEILVIGGGLTGSSTAFWLKQRFRDEDLKVVVVEDNSNFMEGDTMNSIGSFTQQFSIPEHIEMSLFSAEFLRHAGEHLQILDNQPPDINIMPSGFLRLACTNEEAEVMRETWKVQVEKGARVVLLNKEELASRFPFINFGDVVLGSLGLENEGVVNTWQLLSALREKNITLGVQYVKGQVQGFEFERLRPKAEAHTISGIDEADEEKWRSQRITGVHVKPQMTDASARPIRAHLIVNAAGPWAGRVAEMAGIGKGTGLLAVPVPIVPVNRPKFVVHAPDVPPDLPILIDSSGVFCQRTDLGHTFVVGRHSNEEVCDKEINYDWYFDNIAPVLEKRIPFFKSATIKSAFSSVESLNTFDSAPIIGEHPLYNNLYMMCGFGSRNVMHSLAAGRAFAERVFDGAYVNINLRKFDMRRIVKTEKLIEKLKI